MKHLIVATLFVLVCSYTVSSSIRLPGAIISQLSATGKIGDLTHHLAKRQTEEPFSFDALRDMFDCAATEIEYQCSSGYAQQVVNTALACGVDSTVARIIADQCARSENGDFCGIATFRHILDQQSVEGITACFLSDPESCSPTCRSFLESTRSKLGCCINTHTIGSLIYILVNESMWSVCNVPLPADTCREGVSLNPPQDVQTCTVQELFTRLANQVCEPSVGQPLVDALLENSKCHRYAREYVDICRFNANNQRCGTIVGTNVIDTSFDGSSQDSPLALIENSCNSSLSSESCSPSCQSAIAGIANTYGCCVNIFNNSDSDTQSVNLLSYSLWNRCGVTESPGFCTAASTLELSGAATMKAFGWMIAVIMAIHTAVLCI